MTISEVLAKIKSLNLPLDHMAIMGGWCLFLHNLRDKSPDDIDIVVDEAAWNKAKTMGDVEETNLLSGAVVKLENGLIEIYDSWAPGEWDTKNLIDTAEIVDDVRFVNLHNVLKWKKRMSRPKDLEDVIKIERYLSHNNLK